VIFTFKSKFSLFRHSEVLRLRRELKQERALREMEREQQAERLDGLRSSHADEMASLRMGFNAHEERLRDEWQREREKLVDFLAIFKFGRAVYAEKPPLPEMQPTGYLPPQMRRTQQAPLNEDELGQLERFRPKEAS
jgi:hypothetical protein